MSVRRLLDAELRRFQRLADLEARVAAFAAWPLDATITDLRDVLATRLISMEDHRRLHVLVSGLYHQAGADLPLVNQLRAEVATALGTNKPRKEANHVLRQPELPQDGLQDPRP
jgi:hypothetical protein